MLAVPFGWPGSMRATLVVLVVLGLGVPAWSQAPGAAAAAPPPPEGASVQVKAGGQLYQRYCAMCHGVNGRDATVFPRPIWGAGHDLAKFTDAKGLFEYLQLLMPFDDPAKLNDQQKSAIVAYILVRNGTLTSDVVLPVGGSSPAIK
jgi:mono/diheme cytochrome c family protein